MEEKETRPETPPDNNSNDNSERRFFLGPRPATTAALDLLPSVTVFSTIPIASTSTPHPLLPDTAGLTQYATLEGPAVPTFPSTSENAALQEPFHSFYNMDPHSYKSRLLPQQPQQQQEQQQQQEEQQQHDPVAQPDYPVLLQQEEHVWPAAWRTASMRTPRRDRVMAMLNPPSSQLQPRLSDASAQKQVRDSRIFDLRVVEQPRQCRACGFSELDKRPIDPTPIVQLRVHDSEGVIDTTAFLSPFFVCRASLWSPDMVETRDRVFHHVPSQPFSSSSSSSSFSSTLTSTTAAASLNTTSVTSELQLADNLTGPSYSSGATFKNLEGEPAIYFAFPDLSIRVTSQYRLLFSLVDLGRSEVVAEVLSEPFTAYHAKTFPGMQETSALARHLADQGLRLPVRSHLRSKKSQ